MGVEHDAAVRLNQPFLTSVRTGRPFVILKAATSIDGRIAAAAGQRTPITSLPRSGTRNTIARRWTRWRSARRPCWWTIRC